ncbi:hypothetical protein [Paraliomyxa miuraensis]|uniref:hypothetical protein n=1 Tax=Paraliomyxa miuraensis TaxID=376150 RepID=UPI002250C160|nr:hypothetical protein [Paraliomyxa miuraensis]MCX4243278.1 hypothetical protein [Paraliomyxa miuraensis]
MAADNKVISGHACEPEGDDWFTDRSDPRYLENTGGVQSYMCPVVRDDTTGELDFVRVRVDNNTGSGPTPLSCIVHSVSVGGGSQDMEMESTTTAGVQTLEFDLNGFTEYDNGHYVIECVLGPYDRILSYRTAED